MERQIPITIQLNLRYGTRHKWRVLVIQIFVPICTDLCLSMNISSLSYHFDGRKFSKQA